MIRSATWSTVVASLAVSLLVSLSPPPLTVAVLVIEGGALAATFTVNVMSGKLRPGSRPSARWQLKAGGVLQVQPAPLMSVAVKPAGRVSATVTWVVVVAPPALVTVRLYT